VDTVNKNINIHHNTYKHEVSAFN